MQNIIEPKLWAINHAYGQSLVMALHKEQALEKVKAEFGYAGYPYTVPLDQKEAIAWARSMGASVL